MRMLDNHKGVSAVFVAITMMMLIGFAALAIDVGHLYVVRNELKNAADAGALAGTRLLYNDDGSGTVNSGANQIACDAAKANKSDKVAVDVHWTTGNGANGIDDPDVDVQRGHWSFATNEFRAIDSTDKPNLSGKTWTDLDTYNPADPFVNAVKVRTRRQDTPALSFLAGIFGFTGFFAQTEAVAWLGFPGDLAPGEAGGPFAICKQRIVNAEGAFTCETGRMINSASTETSQSGAWTNFQQPCVDAATPPTTRPLICGNGNPAPISLGHTIETTNGNDTTNLVALRTCWMSQRDLDTNGDGIPDKPWAFTVPIIDCGEDVKIGPCMKVTGAVDLNILWIAPNGEDPSFSGVPKLMSNPNTESTWSCTGATIAERQACWNSFATAFNLRTVTDTQVGINDYLPSAIYFLPSCTPRKPTGGTGGDPGGGISRTPKLVK